MITYSNMCLQGEEALKEAAVTAASRTEAIVRWLLEHAPHALLVLLPVPPGGPYNQPLPQRLRYPSPCVCNAIVLVPNHDAMHFALPIACWPRHRRLHAPLRYRNCAGLMYVNTCRVPALVLLLHVFCSCGAHCACPPECRKQCLQKRCNSVCF